jgi:hypothetical protein
MKPQADVIVKRLFFAAEAPNLRACQAIAAPTFGKWEVQYGYNEMMGYWVRFEPHDNLAKVFLEKYIPGWEFILYASHDCGFTREDLIGCLLAVDAQAGKKLPK